MREMDSKGFVFTPYVGGFMLFIAFLTIGVIQNSEREQALANLQVEEQSKLSDYADSLNIEIVQSMVYEVRQRFSRVLADSSTTQGTGCGSFRFNLERLQEGSAWSDWSQSEAVYVKSLISDGNIVFEALRKISTLAQTVDNPERISGSSGTGRGALDNYSAEFVSANVDDSFWHSVEGDMLPDPSNTVRNVDDFNDLDSEYLVNVLNCDGSKDNCNDPESGSFVIVLNFGNIQPQRRVQGPQIEFRELTSGRTVTASLIPDENVYIYVPYRFFKAFANAWRVYWDVENNKEKVFGNAAGSGNLYDPDGLVLGSCDSECKCKNESPSSGPGCGNGKNGISSGSLDLVTFGNASKPVAIPDYNCTSPGEQVGWALDEAFCKFLEDGDSGSMSFKVLGTQNKLCATHSGGVYYSADRNPFGQPVNLRSEDKRNHETVPEWKERRQCTANCSTTGVGGTCVDNQEFYKCSRPLNLQNVSIKLQDLEPGFTLPLDTSPETVYCYSISSLYPPASVDSLVTQAAERNKGTHCTTCTSTPTGLGGVGLCLPLWTQVIPSGGTADECADALSVSPQNLCVTKNDFVWSTASCYDSDGNVVGCRSFPGGASVSCALGGSACNPKPGCPLSC